MAAAQCRCRCDGTCRRCSQWSGWWLQQRRTEVTCGLSLIFLLVLSPDSSNNLTPSLIFDCHLVQCEVSASSSAGLKPHALRSFLHWHSYSAGWVGQLATFLWWALHTGCPWGCGHLPFYTHFRASAGVSGQGWQTCLTCLPKARCFIWDCTSGRHFAPGVSIESMFRWHTEAECSARRLGTPSSIGWSIIIDPHNDQLPVGLIAQLVEHIHYVSLALQKSGFKCCSGLSFPTV